jgi:outer membrane protein OmpA-like peptidoglycan-associated protein
MSSPAHAKEKAMKRELVALSACVVLGLATGPLAAGSLELNAVDFPERTTVDLTFSSQAGAPDAKMTGKVTYRDGQATIEVKFQSMKPAILFGGDITCYVLWAVTRDGQATNLGELLATAAKGEGGYTTSFKNFALMVTTEPYYLVQSPSMLPAFMNDPIDTKKLTSNAFQFSAFRKETPERAMESIREISWDSKTPLELLQARKALEIADRLEADQHAEDFYDEAAAALELANAEFDKSPGSKKLIDYSRRSTALSNEAINVANHRIEGIQLEKEIAARRAEMADLEEQATAAKAAAAALAVETARLSEEKGQLRQQSAVLATQLESALTHVAQTQNTARGYVVNLPDILFDFNKATLKPEAEVVIAKLAGILLVIQNLGIGVEGFTDSTGSPEYNLKLSQERADSVMAFMLEQGVDAQRMKAVGFGMESPVADNDTEEGRSKNRRVQIVLSER